MVYKFNKQWELIYNEVVYTKGVGKYTVLNGFSSAVTILKGNTQAFYIDLGVNAMSSKIDVNQISGNVYQSDTFKQLLYGYSMNTGFKNGIPNSKWYGVIHYHQICNPFSYISCIHICMYIFNL